MAKDFIGEAAARLGLDVQDFVKGANKAKKKFGDIEAAGKRLQGVVKSAAGALAGMYSVGFLRNQVKAAAQMDAFAGRLGVTNEALQAYTFIAGQANVSQQTLTLGWQRMTRRVAEASQGLGEAQTALKELGLDAKALNQLSPDKQFEEIAEALSKVPNQANKVRLAFKLFDSEGVSLIQTMDGGKAALERWKEEARDTGQVVREDLTKSLAALDRSIDRTSNKFSTFTTGVLGGLAQRYELLQLGILEGNEKALRDLAVGGLDVRKNHDDLVLPGGFTIKGLRRSVSEGQNLLKQITTGLNPGGNKTSDVGGLNPSESQLAKIKQAQQKLLTDQRRVRDMRFNLAKQEIEDRLDRNKKILAAEKSLTDAMADIYERQATDARASADKLKTINEQRTTALARVKTILGDLESRRTGGKNSFIQLLDLQGDFRKAFNQGDAQKRVDAIQKVIEKTAEFARTQTAASGEAEHAELLIRAANRRLEFSYDELIKKQKTRANADADSAEATQGVLSGMKQDLIPISDKVAEIQSELGDLKAEIKLVGKERLLNDVQSLAEDIERRVEINIPVAPRRRVPGETVGVDFSERTLDDVDELDRATDRAGE